MKKTALIVAALASLGTAAILPAQDAALRKSDIVRMLSGSTYTATEVAEIVRANCLSFEPTERDYNDFRSLGADAAVLSAIDGCVNGVAQDAPVAQQVPIVVVASDADTIRAAAGSEARISLELRVGGQPAGGLRVVLRGANEDGTAGQWSGSSGPDGRATVLIPAGATARATALSVGVPGARVTGRFALTLQTTAGDAAELFAPVGSVSLAEGTLELGIGVQDAFNNPVGDVTITVARQSDEVVVGSGTTASDGLVTVSIATVRVAGEQALDVRTATQSIGIIPLEGDSRPAAVAFVAGSSQVGLPERRLAGPVIVLVSDSDGNPVDGTLVSFDITNGEADEATSRTGSDGRASVRLTVGDDDSRSITIRAMAGSTDATIDLPVRTRSQLAAEAMARGDRFAAAGNLASAIAAYGEAIDMDPEQTDAWVGLGEARAATGDREAARIAFEQALLIDPGNARALRGNAENAPRRSVFELDVWGGTTDDNSRDAGFRSAEVRVYPTEHLITYLRFDNALNLRHPYLTRGNADIEGYFGGVGLRWGSDLQNTTSFEFGKRESPPADLSSIGTNQNSFTLTQDFGLSGGSGVSLGGWYGRWFDQDDWSVFAEGRFGTGSELTVIPFVSYGDHAGSNVVGADEVSRRAKEKELRGGVRLRYESSSWGVEPGLAVGSVTSEMAAFEGSLFDATARLWVSLGGSARVQGYVRRQTPPGTDSFWTFALGLGFAIQEK